MDLKERIIQNLKQTVRERDAALEVLNDKLKDISSDSLAKVDKAILKNLMVNYLTSRDSNRSQILTVLAHVLDFNESEMQAAGVGGGGASGGAQGWLGGWVKWNTQDDKAKTKTNSTEAVNTTLSEAFIRFLEQESRPRPPLHHDDADYSHQDHGKPSPVNPFVVPVYSKESDHNVENIGRLLLSSPSTLPTLVSSKSPQSNILSNVLNPP